MSYYKKGCWNVICDVCGFEFKSDEVRKRWDGFIVCKDDFEYDHPQKYLRVREETSSVPFVRNEPTDTFIIVCTLITSQGVAGMGTANCARAGIDNNLPNQSI
jgi:hypothetical protein